MMVINFVRNYVAGMGVEFSWVACGLAAVAVLVVGLMSFDKKRQWGIIVAELLLFPAVSGIIVPNFHFSVRSYLLFLFGGALASWYCHKYWWPNKEAVRTPREMLDDFREMLTYFCDKLDREIIKPDYRPKLYKDLDFGGWINVAYLGVQWAMFGAYLLSPMPVSVLRKVWHILAFFVLVAVIKPNVMQGWKLSKKNVALTAGSAFVILAAMAIATWIKWSMR